MEFLVTSGYPPNREEIPRFTILRSHPAEWVRSEWTGYAGDRDHERFEDAAWGFGHGFFEYEFPLEDIDFHKAYRVRVLSEASSRRIDTPQTDDDLFPTTLEIWLNGIRVFEQLLPNHPHDARGTLSYLRGGKGGYGYLAHVTIEGDLLRQIAEATQNGRITLRLQVPASSLAQNGLQIYGAEVGRYPVCPTVVIEW